MNQQTAEQSSIFSGIDDFYSEFQNDDWSNLEVLNADDDIFWNNVNFQNSDGVFPEIVEIVDSGHCSVAESVQSDETDSDFTPQPSPSTTVTKKNKRAVKKLKCPWPNCDIEDRRDNLETHCRSEHAKSKPFVCAHVEYKPDCGQWVPCLYSTGRQNDLATHHRNIHYEAKGKLKDNHILMPSIFYRQYLDQNADFKHYLGRRLQRRLTAVFNKAKKVGDHQAIRQLEMGKLPHLKTAYNGTRNRREIFHKPKFEFCGVELMLNDFSRDGLFDGYVLGRKVSKDFDEDYFERPHYRDNRDERNKWDAIQLQDWKLKVDNYIKSSN